MEINNQLRNTKDVLRIGKRTRSQRRLVGQRSILTTYKKISRFPSKIENTKFLEEQKQSSMQSLWELGGVYHSAQFRNMVEMCNDLYDSTK